MHEIGLALSGGGVKGAAHIGVLKALEENDIKVKYISGTSSGSIVASLYGAGYTVAEIEDIFCGDSNKLIGGGIWSFVKYVVYSILHRRKPMGLISSEILEKVIGDKLALKGINKLCDMPMKIAIPTVDINTGKVYMYNNADIRYSRSHNFFDDNIEYICNENAGKIVRASCSFPGVFIPCGINGVNMIDGGVRRNTPVTPLKEMGATKVIAVAFDYPDTSDENQIDDAVEVLMQSYGILAHQASEIELVEADIVIRPYLKDVKLLDVSKIGKCIEEGYKTAKMQIDKIKEELQ